MRNILIKLSNEEVEKLDRLVAARQKETGDLVARQHVIRELIQAQLELLDHNPSRQPT